MTSTLSRRDVIQLLTAAAGVVGTSAPSFAGNQPSAAIAGRYRPGRIENEYAVYLPGEQVALQTPPTVSAITSEEVTASVGGQSSVMRPNDQLGGWRLLTITTIDSVPTAVFEKHATHRGAIAYATSGRGVIAHIPKQIGQLSQVRPRPTDTPHGVKLERHRQPRADIAGDYILNSAEDPCYENVAALGAEYIGWTLVANEEAGPQHTLYLEPSGKSREFNAASAGQVLWAPDASGPVFDPEDLIFQSALDGFHSKRTLLGGYLPVADIAVWDPSQQCGYEVVVLLPPGADAKPLARLRATLTPALRTTLKSVQDTTPELIKDVALVREDGSEYVERYWNASVQEFHTVLAGLWSKWRNFHEEAMSVEIPDEWLLNAARAGLTLARCSYTGLEPTYQMGEGGYTKVPPSSHALFPVAHYEFIWAHQLWNHCASADAYFQHYLDHYVLPDGNFTYNAQDQVEAPLNIGLFLANSARAYFYTHDLKSLEKRLPVLERMIGYLLKRYQYSKTAFATTDRRHGLIWGSPEADLGDPKKDTPTDHPYYYQNAAWAWRGLEQHAKVLALAAKEHAREDLSAAAKHYDGIARQMRADIRASLATTLSLRSPAMREAGITPFTPEDLNHDPKELESYENHRFMEDWFLADWGDRELDLGHLAHRRLAQRQTLGLGTGTAGIPFMTSNFMAHGTLSVLIRQEDYRPFLLSLYALTCYASDCGNRYAPEDALMPGGHPTEGGAFGWSAVINSTLQPALGLRWLLCYEETDQEVCHLQKAAPKHWFENGKRIAIKGCPTRFGPIDWATQAVGERHWEVHVNIPKGFAATLVIHVHPPDGQPLRTVSEGALEGNKIILRKSTLGRPSSVKIVVT